VNYSCRLCDISWRHSQTFILKCEDLVLFKLSAGRLIDRSDAAYLLRNNREALDIGYLAAWAQRLSISDQLREVWCEAFGPETPPPTTN